LTIRGGFGMPRVNIVLFSAVGLLCTLTIVATYVSTFCRTGLNALMLSIIVAGTLLLIAGGIAPATWDAVYARLGLAAIFEHWPAAAAERPDVILQAKASTLMSSYWWRHSLDIATAGHAVLAIVWLGPLVRLGVRNHRSSLIEPRAVASQLGWLGAWTVACAIATGALGPSLWWAIITSLQVWP
jgi:hypothetical protein